MEDVAKRIVKLDKETSNMKEKYEQIIEGKDEELREKLLELEKKYANESRLEIEKIQNEILNQTDNESMKLDLKAEDMHNLDSIDKTYKSIKDGLLNKLWDQLLLRNE